MRTRSWVLILDAERAEILLRGGRRRLPLDPAVAPRPAAADQIAVLVVRGPLFVEAAAFIALVEVLRSDPDALTLRRVVLAPPGHTVGLRELPSLRVAAGWTHGSLGGLLGTVVPCTSRDLERIAAALLARARAFGPAAKRPAHRLPRTPGRRRLMAGRIAAAGRP